MKRGYDSSVDVRLPSFLKTKLEEHAADSDATMNDVVIAALREHLARDDFQTVSLNYYARLERKYQTLKKRTDVLVEGFALFVRAWLQHHLPIRDEDKKRAFAREAKRRFSGFVDRLERILDEGDGFVDELDRPLRPPASDSHDTPEETS